MFWNDPSLYGATLPYKEIGAVPPPFMGPTFNPWQTFPRFVPPVYGTTPYFDYRFCDPRMFVQPWMQTPQINPFVQPFTTPFAQVPPITPFMQPFTTPFAQVPPITPFMQPFTAPFAQIPQVNPFIQPFNLNLPLHNLYRPFPY